MVAALLLLLLLWAAKLLLLLLWAALAVPLLGLPLAAPLLLLLRILGRTIVCSTVLLPSPGLEFTTTPLELANQQLSLLARNCSTRPSQDSVAASLSKVQMLIRSLEEDLRQTGCIHTN